MNRSKSWDFKTALALLWIMFTVALAVWLFVFHSRLFQKIEDLGTPEAMAILKHHRMVVYEMSTLIFALILGGLGLLWLISLERHRSDQIQQFFAVFTHELKTSLSRLRLQAESILESKPGRSQADPTLRLLDDMGKLEVQLENSLWVARADEDRVLIESLSLSQVLSELVSQFPLTVHLSHEVVVRADRRAFESVLKNIFQNSVVHGEAQNLWIEASQISHEVLQLNFRDDGKGTEGNSNELGQLFMRVSSTSGTGLGLYLIRRLVQLMRGEVKFQNSTQGGFEVQIQLPGEFA